MIILYTLLLDNPGSPIRYIFTDRHEVRKVPAQFMCPVSGGCVFVCLSALVAHCFFVVAFGYFRFAF